MHNVVRKMNSFPPTHFYEFYVEETFVLSYTLTTAPVITQF